jgi:hypothetical protein
MRTSEKIDQLFGALSQAQGEFHEIKMSGRNPHFGQPYATLADIREGTQEALTKYGLSVSQYPSTENGTVLMKTMLAHKSGQWIEEELRLKPDRTNIQGIGATITYARRYSKAAILDVVGEPDDDGESAVDHGKTNAPAGKPVYLNVPFDRKEEAKKDGARWDKAAGKWYVDESKKDIIEKWNGKPKPQAPLEDQAYDHHNPAHKAMALSKCRTMGLHDSLITRIGNDLANANILVGMLDGFIQGCLDKFDEEAANVQ